MISPFTKAQISLKRYYYRTEISYLESKTAGSYDLWGPCQVLIQFAKLFSKMASELPVGPVVKTPPCSAWGADSVSGWGLRAHMPCAVAKLNKIIEHLFKK